MVDQVLQVEDAGTRYDIAEPTAVDGAKFGARTVDLDAREKLEAIRALLDESLVATLDPASLAALETISVGNFPATQPVSGPLTDAQLRAASVPVAGPLTDAQLRAAAVLVSLPGVASQATLAALLSEFQNKYDVVQTAKATYTSSGPHTLITPPAGQALRVTWLFAQAKGTLDTGTVVVGFTLGGSSYEFELTGFQPWMHSAVWEGAVNEPLVVDTSSAAAVMVNCDYRVFTP